MQGGMSTQAPMLPRAVLRLLGAGLRGYYTNLVEQPVPPMMRNTLSRIQEEPDVRPGFMACRQASVMGEPWSVISLPSGYKTAARDH